MEADTLNESFWTQRWEEGKTGWDIGYPSPALTKYAEAKIPKTASILIPGAGNAYEAQWLYEQGWTRVHVLDISHIPLNRIKENHPEFPKQQLIHCNFFDHQGQYDFILEQTFFCALPPTLRPDYVQQMTRLLNPDGRLAGLLFNFPLTEQGPPFGGSIEEYQTRFGPNFEILTLEHSLDSIKPRSGHELAFEFCLRTSQKGR